MEQGKNGYREVVRNDAREASETLGRYSEVSVLDSVFRTSTRTWIFPSDDRDFMPGSEAAIDLECAYRPTAAVRLARFLKGEM